jgi:hypothetical protein
MAGAICNIAPTFGWRRLSSHPDPQLCACVLVNPTSQIQIRCQTNGRRTGSMSSGAARSGRRILYLYTLTCLSENSRRHIIIFFCFVTAITLNQTNSDKEFVC